MRPNLHRVLVAGIALAGCSGSAASLKPTPPSVAAPSATPVVKARAAVNGIQLYYEVHGDAAGTPLVLLHGGGSSIEVTYGQILPHFAQRRRVIALDEQNHGRSEHRNIPERFTDSADDVAALLRHLGIQQADVMGFSNGASVAMHVAVRHPGLVRKLVFAASMTKRSGTAAQFWEYIARGTFESMPQPLKDAHLKVDPDPTRLRDMYEKDAERMRSFVETPDAVVRTLALPTLIVSGDRDVPTPEHAVELFRLLPHARLLIVPGAHGELLGELGAGRHSARDAEVSAYLVQRFLDE